MDSLRLLNGVAIIRSVLENYSITVDLGGFMNERVLVLRDAVVKITQMLSGKGIEVTQSGINAYVRTDHTGRPVLVNLPYLPDNASTELCNAIQGFLDHEVAHILFTDFSVQPSKQDKGMYELLEDSRIEKNMAKKFSGCGWNLGVTGKFFLDKFTTPRMNEAIAAKDTNKLIAMLMVPLMRSMADQAVYKEYMKDKMSYVEPLYEKIKHFQPRIQALASSQDALDLAKEINAILADHSPKGEDDEEGKGSGKGKGKSKSKGKGKGKSGGKGEKSEKSSSEEEEKEKSEDEGEESKDEEDAGESEEKGEDESEDEGGGDTSGESGELSAPEGREGELSDSGYVSEIEKELANGFDKAVSDLISHDATDAAKSAPYLIFSKDKDKVETLRVGSGYYPDMFKDLASAVDHMVAPLQKDLERAIAARSLSQWEPGKRSGRLHAANLSRLAMGDDRVFRRKHEATSKDVAVEVVIDASGSMSGAKIHLATQAAYALSQVLERLQIKHEVLAFTTSEMERTPEMFEAEAKLGRQFSRYEPLNMPILKSFDERINAKVRERFGWLPNSRILANNIDGECIQIAANRLKARRESGKIMMVLSDGNPAAYGDSLALRKHLKGVIKDIEKSGTRIVGLGIMTDCVDQYYSKSIVINDVSELPRHVVKELRHLLVQ